MTDNALTGKRGEDAAVDWLRANGFMIEARNWRSGRYEIDIVASRWGVTHFVEVKTRRAGSLASPEDAITQHKFAALRKAATIYLSQRRQAFEIQFDLVAVDVGADGSLNVRYLENAMQCHW